MFVVFHYFVGFCAVKNVDIADKVNYCRNNENSDGGDDKIREKSTYEVCGNYR